MQVVFDTKTFAAAQRRQAWRDAICEIYLQVDCDAEKQYDPRFGLVVDRIVPRDPRDLMTSDDAP